MVSKKLETVSETHEVVQPTVEKVAENVLEQQIEQIKEVVQNSNKFAKTEDLSKFDKMFDVEFWSWENVEVGIEFNARITSFTTPKNAEYRICSVHARFPTGIEKEFKFIPFKAMETQFQKLGIQIGNVVYIKYLGNVPSELNKNNALSCVVRKLK
jgi:hypothetical protein